MYSILRRGRNGLEVNLVNNYICTFIKTGGYVKRPNDVTSGVTLVAM